VIAFVPGHDEAGEEHEDVSRLAVLAGAEVRQGHPLTLTWLTVIDYSDGFFDQQTRWSWLTLPMTIRYGGLLPFGFSPVMLPSQ
jgi:hypothetical protein